MIIIPSIIIYCLPSVFKFNVTFNSLRNRYIIVQAHWSKNKYFHYFYETVLYFMVLIILPLGTLSFTTFHLTKALKKSHKMKKSTTLHTASQNSKEDVTLSLVIVVIIYAFCQLPSPVRRIWTRFDGDLKCGGSYYIFVIVSITAIHINSSVNFIVFLLLGKRFRKKFLRKIRKLICCKRNQVAPTIETVTT